MHFFFLQVGNFGNFLRTKRPNACRGDEKYFTETHLPLRRAQLAALQPVKLQEQRYKLLSFVVCMFSKIPNQLEQNGRFIEEFFAVLQWEALSWVSFTWPSAFGVFWLKKQSKDRAFSSLAQRQYRKYQFLHDRITKRISQNLINASKAQKCSLCQGFVNLQKKEGRWRQAGEKYSGTTVPTHTSLLMLLEAGCTP